MEELQAAVTALQLAVNDLESRLLGYPTGSYDAEMAAATTTITDITTMLNTLAPPLPLRALELKAVE